MLSNFLNINWIIGLVLISLLANCTSPKEAPKDDNDKKIIHIEEQWVLPPPEFDTLLLKSITEFNLKGKPIEESQYSKLNGLVIVNTKWTYDEHLNIVSKITENFDPNKIYKENYSYEYDEKDRKIIMQEKQSSYTNELVHEYTHFEDGRYIDTIKYQSQVVSIIEFNEDDKVIKENNFQKQTKVNNEFDEYGNFIKRNTSYSNGTERVYNYTNDYDSFGNLIRVTLDHRYREYEYNENGDIVKETRLDTGKPYLIILYKYKYFE